MLRAVSNGNSTIELGRPNPSTSMHGESTGCTNTGTCRRSSSASTGSRSGSPKVVPGHVGGQHHAVEAQFVQRIGEFGQRLLGAVGRQVGEGPETTGVLRDQL